MNKIHASQLFAILMLSGAWSVLCLPEASSGAQLLGIGLAFGIQLILSIPMLLLVRGGFSLTRTVSQHKWLGFIYVLFFLLWGANGFSQLWEVSSEISLPVSGSMTAAVLIIATCLYTCSLGLKTLARCAPLMLGLLVLSLVVLVIGAFSRVDVTRLAPVSEGFLKNGYAWFAMAGEMTAAFVLLNRVRQGQQRALWGYLAGKAAFGCLVVFLCICAAGRLSGLSDYPFFALTTLSQPLQSQRADALYILVFVMLYVMHITLQTSVTSHLLQVMFPRLKGAAPLSLGVMLLLSWAVSLKEQSAEALYAAMILLTAFLIPVIILFLRRYSHENKPPVPPAPASRTADGMRNRAHQ